MNRYALRFVLASIAVNAVIAIVAIVSGDFSDLDGKILITSLSVTGGAVLTLANMAARTRCSLKYVPEAGAVASIIGFSILVYGAWDEFGSENISKAATTAIFIGSGTAHGALLSLSRLAPPYLVVMVITVTWESNVTDSETFARTMGVVGVLLAAVTLAVPVLHRASRGELAAGGQEEVKPGRAAGFCPNCGGAGLTADGAEKRCGACGARFKVEFSA
ncbi:MAG: hypothetical protein O3B04_02550 [Chloroflexi bacterium]|nr:hypothetical protein [Chloroflexota bacterium]MDA1296867.1 hypothetical protein [Chloroflexota bacterium]